MEFSDIKLLDENADLSKIKPFDWDLEIKGIPYYVCRIEGYCHSLRWQGGSETRCELWCYPRHESPSIENLIEYDLKSPVAWGIQYDEIHSTKCKWDETETIAGCRTIITRNGVPFYNVGGHRNYSVPKAIMLISEIEEHPLGFDGIDFDKKIIGRKVYWNNQPGIITSFIHRQCCVMIAPDGMERFENPPEFQKEDGQYYYEKEVKIDCLATTRTWWFRE